MNAVLSAVSLHNIKCTLLWYRNTNRDEASGILFEVKTADTGCCCCWPLRSSFRPMADVETGRWPIRDNWGGRAASCRLLVTAGSYRSCWGPRWTNEEDSWLQGTNNDSDGLMTWWLLGNVYWVTLLVTAGYWRRPAAELKDTSCCIKQSPVCVNE